MYLVQHAKAVEKEIDSERPLSAEGKRDIETVAAFLKRMNLFIERLWHSGKLRAAQTADLLANAVKAARVEERDGLKPNDNVQKAAAELGADEASIMLVGHMPFVSRLASVLLTGSEKADIVKFKQGCVVCLEKGESGKWVLDWMVIHEILC